MFNRTSRFGKAGLLLSTAVLAVAPAILSPVAFGQTSAPKAERWLHVRVVNSDNKGETVRVNVPLELAESVLPTINKENLHNGKVTISQAHLNDVDLHALMNAVRNAKDRKST